MISSRSRDLQYDLARVLLTQRWATAHPHLRFASCHPGWVDTEGLRGAAAMSGFYNMKRRTLRSPAQGADSILWLAAADSAAIEGRWKSGAYGWDRSARRVDLSSATSASEADVDESA